VAWLAVNHGRLLTSDLVLEDELAMFEEGRTVIDLVADGPTEFVIGSAAKHPHPLVNGAYSVHTNALALAEGEGRIVALRTTPEVVALDQSRQTLSRRARFFAGASDGKDATAPRRLRDLTMGRR
jgi:hypothetical protein